MKYRINKEKEWFKDRSKKYTIVLNPGKYSKEYRINIPLGLLLRQQRIKEVLPQIKKILNERKILINGKIVTDRKYPVSVLDIVTIENVNYRLILSKRYKLEKVDEPVLYNSIIRFNELKEGKIQLICKGGYSFLYNEIPKPLHEYVLVKNLTKNDITVLHYSQLNHFIVIKGKHKGYTHLIKDVEIKNNKIQLNNGEIKMDYVLFYNK
jgi:small subunit ribosomal protein S4e